MNNFSLPRLESGGDNLLDFEAASSTNLWASTPNDHTRRAQTIQDDVKIHMMPLTEFEKEAILAVRASNAQTYHQAYHPAPSELSLPPNLAVSEGLDAFGPSLHYGDVNTMLSPNSDTFDGFDELSNGVTQLNAIGGSGIFRQPQSEEAAEKLGVLTPLPSPESSCDAHFRKHDYVLDDRK